MAYMYLDYPRNEIALLRNESQSRRETFNNGWPADKKFLSIDTFVNQGFYFLGNGDRVRCVYCTGVLCQWKEDDNIETKHKRNFPQCPLMKRPMKNPLYRDLSTRKLSFKGCPPQIKQRTDDFAEAGLYYIGQDDKIKCFWCSIMISGWESTDIPHAEHAKFSPRCQWLIVSKGKEFVKKLQQDILGEVETLFNQKTCKTVDIEDVVKKALEELKNNQLIPDYEKHEKKITEVLKEAAQKEATLTTKMFHMIDNKTMREVEKEMSPIIGSIRVGFIKESFAIETYKMKVVTNSDGQSSVLVKRAEEDFQPERMLLNIAHITSATELQSVSLMIELFIVALGSAGIRVQFNEDEMGVLVQNVEVLVRRSAFQIALDTFMEAWNEAGVSSWGKAKAIFYFLKDSYLLEIFWIIINLIVQKTNTWEKIRGIGEIALMIVVAFATDGIALVARILLAVDSAVYLAEKIANLVTFSNLKNSM